MKRVLICGGRNYADGERILSALKALGGKDDIEVVIHGAAPGADTLGGLAAESLDIPVIAEAAKWSVYGKAAGPIRNQKMLDDHSPTHCIAFPDPGSRGTWDMVRRARAAGLEVKVYE